MSSEFRCRGVVLYFDHLVCFLYVSWWVFYDILGLHINLHATCEKIGLHSGSELKVYFIFIILCDPLTCNLKNPTSITLEIRLTVAKHMIGSFYFF